MTILSEHDAGDGVHETASFAERPGPSAPASALREPAASRFAPFSPATARRLHEMADAQGIGVTQLMRQWILERLDAEEHGRRQEQIAFELEQLARRLRASA